MPGSAPSMAIMRTRRWRPGRPAHHALAAMATTSATIAETRRPGTDRQRTSVCRDTRASGAAQPEAALMPPVARRLFEAEDEEIGHAPAVVQSRIGCDLLGRRSRFA